MNNKVHLVVLPTIKSSKLLGIFDNKREAKRLARLAKNSELAGFHSGGKVGSFNYDHF